MTDFYWLGRRFPITNAKTRVSILKGTSLLSCFIEVVVKCRMTIWYCSFIPITDDELLFSLE
jgi:hypothetical protein